MKIYKIKKLINGFQLGRDYRDMKLVACKSSSGFTHIQYRKKLMELPVPNDVVTRRNFKDKFGRGTYELSYYHWIPSKTSKVTDSSLNEAYLFQYHVS